MASGAVALSFFVSVLAFFRLLAMDEPSLHVLLWDYLSAGDFSLSLGFTIDPLSNLLMMVITGVGLLIHIYSVGYMHGDEGFSRYFSNLNLFVASMLVLVMADSYLFAFVGWEGVGVCSYLLISFWYGQRANADAARKAFIVNRIGDVGFLIAMFLVFRSFGTLNIAEVNEAVLAGTISVSALMLTLIGIHFLIAACGKSAQFPLHVWLPDAMAGPTPVSALIHAATMVTAGVYLIARSAPLFAASPLASAVVAWVGVITALIAALAALTQTDIKKILAYSTISQLGYMFVAVGVGAYWVGVFHLFTHAFFKALLFLASGSVIHALGGEQDIRKMGGLGKYLPSTNRTSLIATLAIAGVPFLAGFFSKDAILAHTVNSKLLAGYGTSFIYLILLVTAGLTAFYMFRWYHCVFMGQERLTDETRAGLHESPEVMTIPLVILAFFSIFAGYIGLPEFAFPNWIAHWLEHATQAPAGFEHPSLTIEWMLVGLSVVAAGIGLGLAYWIYERRQAEPAINAMNSYQSLYRFFQSGLGFDGFYRRVFIRGSEVSASSLAMVDEDVVDKGVISVGWGVSWFSGIVQHFQSGLARAYALAIMLGVLVLVLIVLFYGVNL